MGKTVLDSRGKVLLLSIYKNYLHYTRGRQIRIGEIGELSPLKKKKLDGRQLV